MLSTTIDVFLPLFFSTFLCVWARYGRVAAEIRMTIRQILILDRNLQVFTRIHITTKADREQAELLQYFGKTELNRSFWMT